MCTVGGKSPLRSRTRPLTIVNPDSLADQLLSQLYLWLGSSDSEGFDRRVGRIVLVQLDVRSGLLDKGLYCLPSCGDI